MNEVQEAASLNYTSGHTECSFTLVMEHIRVKSKIQNFRKEAAEIDRLGFEETIRMVARKEAEGLTITFLRLGGGQSWGSLGQC